MIICYVKINAFLIFRFFFFLYQNLFTPSPHSHCDIMTAFHRLLNILILNDNLKKSYFYHNIKFGKTEIHFISL